MSPKKGPCKQVSCLRPCKKMCNKYLSFQNHHFLEGSIFLFCQPHATSSVKATLPTRPPSPHLPDRPWIDRRSCSGRSGASALGRAPSTASSSRSLDSLGVGCRIESRSRSPRAAERRSRIRLRFGQTHEPHSREAGATKGGGELGSSFQLGTWKPVESSDTSIIE